MKKNILLLTTVLFANLVVFAQNPDLFIGDVKVRVEPQTLVYVTNDLEANVTTAANYTDISGWVSTGAFANADATTAGDDALSANGTFRLQNGPTPNTASLNDNRDGGQLIIRGGGASSGLAEVVRDVFPNQSWVQVAFPFTSLTYSDAVNQFANGQSPVIAAAWPARGGNSFLRWNNNTLAFEELAATDDVGGEYIIYNANSGLTNLPLIAGTTVSPEGVPAGASSTKPMVPTLTSISGYDYTTGTNSYGEAYNTYIGDLGADDVAITEADANYGTNHYQFANPYPSNIDLSYIGVTEDAATYGNDNMAFVDNIQAIAYFTSVSWDANQGVSASTVETVTFDSDGEFSMGDPNLLVIPPLTPFIVQIARGNTTTLNFEFSDAIKTFSNTARAATDVDGNPGTAGRPSSGSDGVQQMGLKLYDGTGEALNSFYVGASDNALSADFDAVEAETEGVSGRNSSGQKVIITDQMYSVQERLDGGLDDDYKMMSANVVNTDFEKAIPVVFVPSYNSTGGDYVLKMDFRTDTGRDNIMLEENENFASGIHFYFHDKMNDEYVRMDGNFEYAFTVNTQAGEAVANRFEIFYGEPETLSTVDPNTNAFGTKVFKIAEGSRDYAIRFSQEQLGNTAQIYVYNGIGQLIDVSKEVTTGEDYSIPLANDGSNFYVVKIIGENGTVVTEKIVR